MSGEKIFSQIFSDDILYSIISKNLTYLKILSIYPLQRKLKIRVFLGAWFLPCPFFFGLFGTIEDSAPSLFF